MTEQQETELLVYRYFDEVLNLGDLAVLDELMARDCLNHDTLVGRLPPGPQGLKPLLAFFHDTFAQAHFMPSQQLIEGDRVVIHWMMAGIHRGDFMDIEPTGRPVKLQGTQSFRICNGKLVEHRSSWDHQDLRRQLEDADR